MAQVFDEEWAIVGLPEIQGWMEVPLSETSGGMDKIRRVLVGGGRGIIPGEACLRFLCFAYGDSFAPGQRL